MEYRLNIKKIEQSVPGIICLELGRPDNEPIFNFKPGQYAMISYRNKQGLIEDKHAFSIASSPLRNHSICLGIRIGGAFTSGLVDLSVGQEILLAGPYGSLVFNEIKTPNPVFIAGGIGITPFISYLEYAFDKRLKNDIHLIYCARNHKSAAYLQDIKILEGNMANLSVLYKFSDDSGRLTAAEISKFVGDIRGKSFYLCGPEAFMKTVTSDLLSLGVAKKGVITEAFSMIADQGAPAVLKNLAYAFGFMFAIFIPIFYTIDHRATSAGKPAAGSNVIQSPENIIPAATLGQETAPVAPTRRRPRNAASQPAASNPVTIPSQTAAQNQPTAVSQPVITQPAAPVDQTYIPIPQPRTQVS